MGDIITYDINGKARIYHQFNNRLVFVNKNSFLQHSKVQKEIRKYVFELMKLENAKSLTCIGGESYIFGMISNIEKIYAYTNSESIFEDMDFNNDFYKSLTGIFLIDYNLINKFYMPDLIICNVANLNIFLIDSMNKSLSKTIIIINCHHTQFWERKYRFTNYKLTSRKTFIADGFFVSVSIFRLKEFVPLGNTCAIAYNLNRLKIRYNAYPFDWCKLSTDKLINVLLNDFDGFTDLKLKKISSNHEHFESQNKESLILTNKYDIAFAHEVLKMQDLDEFKNKLKLRIDRFKKLNNCIFVVFNMKDKDVNLLDVVLKSKFKTYEIRNVIRDSFTFSDWKFKNVSWLNQLNH